MNQMLIIGVPALLVLSVGTKFSSSWTSEIPMFCEALCTPSAVDMLPLAVSVPSASQMFNSTFGLQADFKP